MTTDPELKRDNDMLGGARRPRLTPLEARVVLCRQDLGLSLAATAHLMGIAQWHVRALERSAAAKQKGL